LSFPHANSSIKKLVNRIVQTLTKHAFASQDAGLVDREREVNVMAATAALKGFIDTQNLGPGLQVFLKEAGRKSAVNWVRIAIFQLGGPERAAARLGVKLPEVHGWLKNGVRGLPYRDVERLAFASRIPMSLLGRGGVRPRQTRLSPRTGTL